MAGLGVGMGSLTPSKDEAEAKILLNTCIHNYLVNEGLDPVAEAFLKSGVRVDQRKISRDKQTGRAGGDDADSKEDNKANVGVAGDNFLLEYWFIFWDLWNSAKNPSQNTVGGQYLNFNQQRAAMRQPMFQQQMLAQGLNGGYPRMMPGAMGSLQQKAINNNVAQRNMNPQQFQHTRMPVMNQHQAMARDGSDMDGAQRGHSPNSNDDVAGSPGGTKRPRLAGEFNQQQMAGQRGPMAGQMSNGVMGNQEAMMMQNGKQNQMQGMMGNGKDQQSAYSRNLANQQNQQSVGMVGNFPPGAFGNGPGQMSPPMGMDGQFGVDMMNNGRMVANGNGPANGNGGALADYQMQLMLLEQQNKKRLMMARQEQDVAGSAMPPGPGGPGAPMPQGSGFGMGMNSPHARNGQSPAGDSKRKSPMGQGSPLPDGSMPNRNSPGVGNFEPNPGNMGGPHFMPQMNNVLGGPGVGMRPPSSHPMGNAGQVDLMRGARMPPNGNWQGGNGGGPMQGPMGGPGVGAQQNAGDSAQAQRSNMPPPSAPTNGVKAQPSPTPQNAAPPTPSGGAKTNAKAKKDTKDTKKKPKKSQSTTNATPNPEAADRPPTPTPQTPATPVAPESHIIKGQPSQGQAPQAGNGQMHPPQSVQQQQAQQQHQQSQGGDVPMNQAMAGTNGMDPFATSAADFLDFIGQDQGHDDNMDVLSGFDFDQYLVGGEGGELWTDTFGMTESLESGAGQ